jgi:carboxypeptidase Taq
VIYGKEQSLALANLKDRLEKVTSLAQINALLEWDMQVKMPPGGSEARARHMSVLSRLIHETFTADETGALLAAAEREANGLPHDSNDASLLRVARHDYDRDCKLPSDLVAEITKATTLAHGVWVKARAENDFKSFVPSLKRIVELKKRAAECYGYTDHIYDALLDTYEPGLKTADVVRMFADLRRELVPLVQAIRERVDVVDDSALHQDFNPDKQREFAELVVKKFGYDFSRGRQDPTVHPFATSFSRNDVRITTRFDPKWLNPALFGTLHEAGHGMYEQGVGEDLEGNILASGVSLGVHESQSRLWENIVGRSRAFWSHFFPVLQSYFPDQLGRVDVESFYRAINRVKPSYIRVEADEATYTLHIMLRFELETDLLAGKLKVEELPDAWNEKSQAYLSITPPTDTLGVLQDVHWSSGLIGYFPTYALGTILSAQLYDKAVEQNPSIPADMARGEFGGLLTWLRENIHRHGRKFDPPELIQRATGEPLQSRSYIRYLKGKFGEIYRLS